MPFCLAISSSSRARYVIIRPVIFVVRLFRRVVVALVVLSLFSVSMGVSVFSVVSSSSVMTGIFILSFLVRVVASIFVRLISHVCVFSLTQHLSSPLC